MQYSALHLWVANKSFDTRGLMEFHTYMGSWENTLKTLMCFQGVFRVYIILKSCACETQQII